MVEDSEWRQLSEVAASVLRDAMRAKEFASGCVGVLAVPQVGKNAE